MTRHRVELYTRQRCCLCDEAKRLLGQVRRDLPFELVEIDVDQSPALAARYGDEVPVILVDGVRHAKLRLDSARLRRRLAAPAPEIP